MGYKLAEFIYIACFYNAGFPFLPWDFHENGNQIAKTNGNGREIGIAQMGIGTFIINVFPPLTHNFPFKICI